MAGLKTSRGWTREEESVPTETVWVPITAFLVSSKTTTKRSLSRWAIRGRSRRSTSPGEEITGLWGAGSETILLPPLGRRQDRRRLGLPDTGDARDLARRRAQQPVEPAAPPQERDR